MEGYNKFVIIIIIIKAPNVITGLEIVACQIGSANDHNSCLSHS